ncbi:MAG: hypothetical protein IJ561_03555 [Ruminococcus sp.]|nr:hypothetical protein [Ruminococcus sp.]
MSATMHRSRNRFEMLAPLWAFLGMALHIGAIWYVFFYSDSFSLMNDYNNLYKYLIWSAVVLAGLFSFVPEDLAAIVKHVLYYLVAAGVGLFALYWYAENKFSSELSESKLLIFIINSGGEEDYAKFYVTYAVKYSLGLCAAVAGFCVIKHYMSSKGWINKKYNL